MDINILRQTLLNQRRVRIAVVVPVFNEATGIRNFLRALHQTLSQLTEHGEIIVVDDGSRDQTVAVLQELLAELPIKLICFSRNFGKEMALTAGLQYAKADVVILMDADFQHPLELLPTFLQQWAEGYDMVYGVRRDRRNETVLRRFFSQVFYRLMARFASVDLPPNAGDFRLLDAAVVKALNQCPERSRFMKGLYSWVGFKTQAIPFTAPSRATGTTSWHFRKLTSLALTGIISFSDIPLRVWGFIGFIISSIAFAYGLYVIISTLVYGVDVPGYATLVAAIMFFGGIQLLSIGILGEYIARIFNEVKRRPPYIIASMHGFEDINNSIVE
ncbi:MAG: glycosyltransferase family 2 protein [Gammaproteobacteria bacterium]